MPSQSIVGAAADLTCLPIPTYQTQRSSRDLVWINLLTHLTVWSTFTVLLWAFFLEWLPFNMPNKVIL